MKRIMLVLSILFTLSFVACENPFKKLEDTIDAVEAAANLGSNMDAIQNIFTTKTNPEDLTDADLNTIQTALQDIKTVLSNDATASIIQEYASSQGISLEQDMIVNVQSYVNNFSSGGSTIDLDDDGNTTQEDAIINLVNDILNIL